MMWDGDDNDDEMEKARFWVGCFNGTRQLTSKVSYFLSLGKEGGVVVAACVQSVSKYTYFGTSTDDTNARFCLCRPLRF